MRRSALLVACLAVSSLAPPALAGPEAERGRTLLRAMARHFAEHPARCTLALKIDEQGTMGLVQSTAQATLAIAGPNRFAFASEQLLSGEQNRGYRCVIRSDGRYLLRCEWDRYCVREASPTLAAAVRSPLLVCRDPWRPDVKRLLALFDPAALEALLSSCDVSYRGQVVRDGQLADVVRIADLGQNGPGRAIDTRAFQWDVTIRAGGRPLPLEIRKNLDWLFPSLDAETRSSDTTISFADWSFEREQVEQALALQLPTGAKLVADPDAVFTWGDRPNPMVGRSLPEFRARGADGAQLTSQELLGSGPLVLVLWSAKFTGLKYMLQNLQAITERHQDRARFVALHVGDSSPQEIEAYLGRLQAAPRNLSLEQGADGFRPGTTSTYLWRREPTPFKVGELPQAYLVAEDGTIHAVQTGLSRDPAASLGRPLEALLGGKSWIEEQARLQAEQRRRLQALEAELAAHVARPRAKRR